MSKELININYIPERSAATDYTSSEFRVQWAVDSIAFQFVFTGQVAGTAVFQARIIPEKWEQLEGCDPITFDIDQLSGSESTKIVVIPQTANYCAGLRIVWTSLNAGATGSFSVGSRIMPI